MHVLAGQSQKTPFIRRKYKKNRRGHISIVKLNMLNFHKVVISLTEFTETLKHLFISILTYGLLIFFIFIYFIYLFFREN